MKKIKSFSFLVFMLALAVSLPFFLSACDDNGEDGKVLYKLTSLHFETEDTSTNPEVEKIASDDVIIGTYAISSAYASVYDSDYKISTLTSRSNGSDKLLACPTYNVTSNSSLYFYGDTLKVSLRIYVALNMENVPSLYPTDGYFNNPADYGSVKYEIGEGDGKLVEQEDGSYLLTVHIFDAAQSYNGNTYYNSTSLTLRFEKVE